MLNLCVCLGRTLSVPAFWEQMKGKEERSICKWRLFASVHVCVDLHTSAAVRSTGEVRES